MSEKKKILVTGSCGFVFGNFIRHVIYKKHPYKIVSVDRIREDAPNSMYFNKSHTFYVADIKDQHVMDAIFQLEKPDIVIHGAAEISNSSLDLIPTNVLGTQVIINSCLKSKVEKLIYVSSEEVYGQLMDESYATFNEMHPLNPSNQYSATKAAGELLVKAASKSHGLIYNIVRPCSNYGPRQTVDGFIPAVLKGVLSDSKVIIKEGGMTIRSWINVMDTSEAIINIIENGVINQTYNISTEQECSNIELVQKICNTIGKGHDLVSFTGPDNHYACDSTKIKKLGWQPSYKFKDGIASVIEWFLANKWMFR